MGKLAPAHRKDAAPELHLARCLDPGPEGEARQPDPFEQSGGIGAATGLGRRERELTAGNGRGGAQVKKSLKRLINRRSTTMLASVAGDTLSGFQEAEIHLGRAQTWGNLITRKQSLE
jgi:hypothetical protein